MFRFLRVRKRERKMKIKKHCCPDLLRSGKGGTWLLTIAYCISLLLLSSAMQLRVQAEEGYDKVAGTASMGKVNESLAPYGMTPVSGNMIEDGEYIVGTECSSSFFRIEEARLTVQGGEMTAVLKMYSSSYLLVYPGTAEEAAAASYEDYISSEEDTDGWDTFTIPVEALDKELDLAAFSKKKKMWYPRKILLHAADIPRDALLFEYPDYDRIGEALTLYDELGGSEEGGEAVAENGSSEKTESGADAKKGSAVQTQNGNIGQRQSEKNAESESENVIRNAEPQAVRLENLADGEYSIEVSLAGGSGRASVTTPTWLLVQDGRAYARLLWSSPYYDYMILDGKKYLNETTDGGSSSFTIPVTAMDAPVQIIADTTAMGDPVEIDYTLTFYEDTVGSRSRVPQEGALRVLAGAAVFIVVGGIANHWIKKHRQ